MVWKIVVFGKVVMAGNHKEHLGTCMLLDQSIPKLCERHGVCDATHPLYAREGIGHAARWCLGWRMKI